MGVFKLVKPSPSSDPHEQGGKFSNKHMTIVLITDCSTITYKNIDGSLKTAKQMTSIQLNTVDWSPMTALGIATLQLRIADFKLSHNFIICDKLPKMELLFDFNVQKKFSLSYAWDREKNCYIQKEGRFLTYTRNCEQKEMLLLWNQPLKYCPNTMTSYLPRSRDMQLRDI